MGWVLAIAVLARPAHGQAPTDFIGARSVIKRMLATPVGSALLNPKVVFCNDLENFADRSAKLSPAEAAHAWLALLRRAYALDGQDPFRQGQLVNAALQTLPAPDSWPIISQNLAEVGSPACQRALELLFDLLAGDGAAAKARLTAMSKEDPSAPIWNSIRLELAIRTRDADEIEEAVRTEADECRANPPYGMRSGPTTVLPNLVPLLGAKRAERVISYVLFTARAELVDSGSQWALPESEKATIDLARKIAITNVDRLAWPQWTLATGPDSGDLYVRMARRFPQVTIGMAYDSPPSWSTMQGAAVSCFANLYGAGDFARARAFGVANRDTLSFGWSSQGDGRLAGRLRQTGKLHGFVSLLDDLSLEFPDSALPSLDLAFSRESQPLSATEAFLRRLVSLKQSAYRRQAAMRELSDTLLQEGKLAEAASVLLANEKDAAQYQFGSAAGLLKALGRELHRPDLTRRGLAAKEPRIFGDTTLRRFGDLDLVIKQGRRPQVEKALIGDLRSALARTTLESPPPGPAAALALARFYFEVGRFPDVVTLLDKFSGWKSPDLQFLERLDPDQIVMAAKSLAAVGRRGDALQVLRFGLAKANTIDTEYELYLSLDLSGAIAFLQDLVPARPRDSELLKWQAVGLFRLHRLPAAEAVIRRAIALGSDVNHYWHSEDLTAFSVLASILSAERRLGEANRLRPYALAALHQQQADEFDQLEMRQLAIPEFRKAVALLPENFLLRLSLGLDEMRYGSEESGKTDIVEAFRHIPPYGGVSEQMLKGELLSNPTIMPAIREELRSQVRHGTKNAMVFSCLAAIESASGDPSSAIENLRRAVALEPDCLEAWRDLQDLGDWLPLEFRKQVALALVRLNDQNASFMECAVPDYPAAWIARAHRSRRTMAGVHDVYVLRASRSLLERSDDQDFVTQRVNYLNDRLASTPGAYISQDPLIRAAQRSFDRRIDR